MSSHEEYEFKSEKHYTNSNACGIKLKFWGRTTKIFSHITTLNWNKKLSNCFILSKAAVCF